MSPDGGRRHDGGGVSRGALLAVPAFAATIALCAILTSLGWWMTAMIVAVMCGLCFVPFITRSILLALGGLILCATAGVLATSIETPLFGETVRDIPVLQATTHPGAAIFHFSDGRVLSRAVWEVPVYGQTKGVAEHELYRLRIAPIVGDGWTPDQPITAWAVTSSPSSDMPRNGWSRPSRAGVRVVSSSTDDIRAAIARATQNYNLTSASSAVLIHWLDDPEAAVAAQYWKLFTVFCVCAVIWGMLAGYALMTAGRKAAA